MTAKPRKTAPAAPAKGGFDLDALVSGAKQVNEMPKIAAQARPNPLRDLVVRSLNDGKPFSLPAVPADKSTALVNRIRAAATREGLKVTTRKQATDEGVVVTLQAQKKG